MWKIVIASALVLAAAVLYVGHSIASAVLATNMETDPVTAMRIAENAVGGVPISITCLVVAVLLIAWHAIASLKDDTADHRAATDRALERPRTMRATTS